jgi:hypothetical protein
MLQRRSITASFHDEFAKEQEFGDKCLQLQYELVHVTVNQVMVPSKFWETLERCNRLRSRGINVTLKPQSDPTASFVVQGYSQEMLDIMQHDFQQQSAGLDIYQIRLTDGKDNYYVDQAERFNAFGFNKFSGWTCNSGYQSVIIKGDEVKRGYSCHDKPLGSVTKGFKLFEQAQTCVTNTCVSSADSKVPKCQQTVVI